jgi:hypothetical protein
MPDRDYDWIARRAYTLWEDEGRPDGRDADHWQTAEQDWQALATASDRTRSNAKRRVAKARALTPDAAVDTGAGQEPTTKAGKTRKR